MATREAVTVVMGAARAAAQVAEPAGPARAETAVVPPAAVTADATHRRIAVAMVMAEALRRSVVSGAQVRAVNDAQAAARSGAAARVAARVIVAMRHLVVNVVRRRRAPMTSVVTTVRTFLSTSRVASWIVQ